MGGIMMVVGGETRFMIRFANFPKNTLGFYLKHLIWFKKHKNECW